MGDVAYLNQRRMIEQHDEMLAKIGAVVEHHMRVLAQHSMALDAYAVVLARRFGCSPAEIVGEVTAASAEIMASRTFGATVHGLWLEAEKARAWAAKLLDEAAPAGEAH